MLRHHFNKLKTPDIDGIPAQAKTLALSKRLMPAILSLLISSWAFSQEETAGSETMPVPLNGIILMDSSIPKLYRLNVSTSPNFSSTGHAVAVGIPVMDREDLDVPRPFPPNDSRTLVIQSMEGWSGSAIVEAHDLALIPGHDTGGFWRGHYTELNKSNQKFTGQWAVSKSRTGGSNYILIAKLETSSLIQIQMLYKDTPLCCNSNEHYKFHIYVDGQWMLYETASLIEVTGKEIGLYVEASAESEAASGGFGFTGMYTIYYGATGSDN